LEIAGEGLDQVVPVGDLPRGQVLQPGSSGVGEEQGEVADDEVIVVRSTQLAGQPIVAELPELFQLKCLSPALEARPHLNGNNPSMPRI
jgi:hypothetical protein